MADGGWRIADCEMEEFRNPKSAIPSRISPDSLMISEKQGLFAKA